MTILLLLMTIASCSDSADQNVLTMKVRKSDFEFSVTAKGELISAKEVSINAPTGNRGQLTLAWMAEENSRVKAGEVVARFDGTEHELEKQRAELELKKNQLTEAITSRDLDYGQFSIGQQTQTVIQEKQMVERFSVDDLTVYSKNEIIDQLLSKEYLTAQALYLNWRKTSQQVQGEAQLQLLNLEGKGYVEAIELSAGALNNLEVVAPTDGVFIHSKNWRGEKVRVGQSLWPGSRLGSLPSLNELQARLFVLETEAAGIEIGLPAEIVLDAYVDRVITGKTVAVANIAAQRNNSNPTKYFEVTVALDESDPEFMRPGQKLEGTIYISRKADVISVPNQAVFQKDGEYWVYVKRGKGFFKQDVTVGLRSLTRTEITSGLDVGDEISLLRPQVVSS
ncbi:MAG TPA: efflux RND transporter periplasmic adaptor subunit [Cellvibrionaceae bacterium]